MSSHSTLDRETFQQFLASVFAVQESRMDNQSLFAIMNVQRLVTTGRLDVDGAMLLIAESARNVANATGVAIGLLEGNRLIYRAGSGSAATYIGRHVTASLTASADARASREILRVENTQTDTRIEAAICRHFGAKSLLILPISQDRAVVGVLAVLFGEAHAFQDREVRTYHLMAEQIEAAISQAARRERGENLATEQPTTPHVTEQITTQGEKFLNDGGALLGPANNHSIYQRCGTAWAVAKDLPALRQPALLATRIIQRARDVTWHTRRRNLTLAAVATVLGLTCWIAYSRRGPASPLGSSALRRSIAIEPQAPAQRAKAMLTKDTSGLQRATVLVKKKDMPARTMLRRMRVGKNEVDYIGDDVTVRYFTYRTAPQRRRVAESRIAYIGDDVTVRYFTPKLAVKAQQPVRP
jgi:hypothetical protein